VGAAYREHLVSAIARGRRGTNTDLVAYFVLRAVDLVGQVGQIGLVATNSLTQGDTRDVGLGAIVGHGCIVRRGVRSRAWPSRSAVLEYCIVWITTVPPSGSAELVLDGARVQAINASLSSAGRVAGDAQRLAKNAGAAFLGHHVNGMGLVLIAKELSSARSQRRQRESRGAIPGRTRCELRLRL
jgi:hypothetical protein